VLVIRRIHVQYRLRIASGQREVAERVLGFHTDVCPVARTLRGCIDISTSLDMQEA
jgi:organic hydroperoxide reductase OsmC/OhrA